MPCYRSEFGWWDGSYCYLKRLDPQPTGNQPQWPGDIPADGAIYEARCVDPDNPSDVFSYLWQWFRDSPPGTPVSPGELARRAVDSMTLLGADIQTTPRRGRAYVGLPVWLWTTRGPTRWGPNRATASVPGLSVTVVARAVKIIWSMGDGGTVTCRSPGAVYRTGLRESPDCGYVYVSPSSGQPMSRYTVTATTTWSISWRGGGAAGALVRTRTSRVALEVGELQALIRDPA